MEHDVLLQRLSKKIRTKRHEQGYSQEELAFRANIDRSYLSELETGKKSPSLQIFISISEALEVSPDNFLKEIVMLSHP